MNRLDRVILYVILGGAPPLLLMLIAWRLGMDSLPLRYVALFALTGLILGLLTDLFILGEFVRKAFTLPFFSLIMLYAFYLFLFWILNYQLPWQSIIPGLGAGWFVGRKAYFMGGGKILLKQMAKKANTICFIGTLTTFTGTIMVIFQNRDVIFQWPAKLGIHLTSSFWVTIAAIVTTAIITLALQWVLIRELAILSFNYWNPETQPNKTNNL